jgi:hypothetical protein
VDSVKVDLFGRKVTAVLLDGTVGFERGSFIDAIGKPRARRIYEAMSDAFEFMGQEGIDALIADGKENLLCETVLLDSGTPMELREYAKAWVCAYTMLKGER